MFRLYLYLIVHKIFPIRGYFFPVGLLYLVVTPYISYYMSWLGIALFIIVGGFSWLYHNGMPPNNCRNRLRGNPHIAHATCAQHLGFFAASRPVSVLTRLNEQ